MTKETRIVAKGIWLYDGQTPKPVWIVSKPAKYHHSRYDEDDDLIESAPIPETPDGLIYVVDFHGHGTGTGFSTLEEAKEHADSLPWGPVNWDSDEE